MKLFVTGGAGFIGSALVRLLLAETDTTIVNIDKMTYAAHPKTLEAFRGNSRHVHAKVDIRDDAAVEDLFAAHYPDGIVHLAAESHVDRSIDSPAPFLETNVLGTCTLLQHALEHWRRLDGARRERFRFLHVSSDEVYGSLGEAGQFTEASPYRPNSPYAASKASSDHLARAWHRTYGLPVVITNCTNNYGPYQFPEKLIPLMVTNAVRGKALPVYGRGDNVRDWLFVEDHVRGVWTAFQHGRPGECYNIGGNCERRNLDLVRQLCAILDDMLAGSRHRPHADLITFVADRPGHDFRYVLDTSKIRGELGWAPRETLESGLAKTVKWYLDNRSWWQTLHEKTYDGERLGLDARRPDKVSARDRSLG